MKIGNYFKNERVAKIVMGVLIFLIILFVTKISTVRAEDNKTVDEPKFTKGGFPIILDADKWPSQIIYDTVGACYQGTIRWVVLSHPSLYGQIPTLAAQRQMAEHCFCVMDKIRHEIKLEEYIKKVLDPEWGGNTFMLKAMECVNKYKTLPSFFTNIIEPPPDNKTTTNDNEKIVIPEKSEDSKDELPSQKPKESEEDSTTIFQG